MQGFMSSSAKSKTWRMTRVRGMSAACSAGSAPPASKCERPRGVRRAACFPQETMNLPHRSGRSQDNKDVFTKKKFMGSSKLESEVFLKKYPQEQQPHGKRCVHSRSEVPGKHQPESRPTSEWET